MNDQGLAWVAAITHEALTALRDGRADPCEHLADDANFPGQVAFIMASAPTSICCAWCAASRPRRTIEELTTCDRCAVVAIVHTGNSGDSILVQYQLCDQCSAELDLPERRVRAT